jgi:NADPH oxidase 5
MCRTPPARRGTVGPSLPPPAPNDSGLLTTLERAFRRYAGADARIDVHELKAALGLESEYLARRVLMAFDRDGDGTIDREEFIQGVRELVLGTDREKLAFAFRVHDDNGDGFIDAQELLRMIAISLAESGVTRETQPPEHLARALFATADRDGDGRVSFEELERVVRCRPELLSQMTRNEAVWLVPNEDLAARIASGERVNAGRWPAAGGWSPLAFGALWAIANVAIFALALRRTPPGPAPDPVMQIGRACGACIELDGALVLVPMMRRLLTRVRASGLGRLLPVDDAVAFHRLLGHTLYALALAHAAAFVWSYVRGHPQSPVGQLLFATPRGLSGVALLRHVGVRAHADPPLTALRALLLLAFALRDMALARHRARAVVSDVRGRANRGVRRRASAAPGATDAAGPGGSK